MIQTLDRVTPWLVVFLPPVLVLPRGAGDILLSVIALLFLLRSALVRDWRWLRQPWVLIALAWWAWLVVCSVPLGTELRALVILRFIVFAAGLQVWLLREPRIRFWLERSIRWTAFYFALQCALQFATGRNLFGDPRGPDGELTGPFQKPRTGPVMARLLFPAIVPLGTTLTRAFLWLAGGIGLMVLIGQRMPILLSFLGLFITALFLRRLRMPVLYAAVAVGILLAALPQLSPQAAHRVETKFAAQMEDFSRNHYGLLMARGVAMLQSSPLIGVGFDGFRLLCDEKRYFHGWHGGNGGGEDICTIHPHNFYLQAALESGIPGLILFIAMAIAWLLALGRGLWREPDPLRVGLFAAVCIQLWPIAGTTDWVAMPVAAWFYLLLGLALALAPPYIGAKRDLAQER